MKLLELKGRDRDKLIALKKGLFIDMPDYSKGITQRIAIDCKCWSTDDKDSLELLNELPKPIALIITENNCEISINDKGVDEYGVPIHKGFITYEEGTLAGAVSGIWLRWYYNTQWLKKVGIKIIPDDMIPNT